MKRHNPLEERQPVDNLWKRHNPQQRHQSVKGNLGLGKLLAEGLHDALVRQPTPLLLDAAVVGLDKQGEGVGRAGRGRERGAGSVPALLCQKLEAPAAMSANFLLRVQGLGVAPQSE